MGLHLCYQLTLPGDTHLVDVAAKLDALKRFAATVGFEAVLGPTAYTLDDPAEDFERTDIVRLLASTMCGMQPQFPGIAAEEPWALGFLVLPGRECEPAAFGFVRPGSRDTLDNPDAEVHPGEWYWSSCCKTQYASIVGDDHLVKCHLGLVSVLDHALALGIGVTVDDETEYWKHRSTTRLIKVVADMNRLIARLAGELNDRWERDHAIEAPIFGHPDFEHLEMERIEADDQPDGSR
jgi:hypothetical protein